MNKFRTLLVAVVALAAPLMGVAQAEPVKVGIDAQPYPPFTVPNSSGEWGGWEIEIMQAVCKTENLDCEVQPVAWDGIIPALDSGKIDMIFSSMSRTAEREKVVAFSDRYWKAPIMLVGPKGSDMKPTAEGLSDKLFGVQTSTPLEIYAKKYFTGATLKYYPSLDAILQDLVAGRIDATMAGAPQISAFLKTDEGAACCENIGTVNDDPEIFGVGVSAAFRKQDSELKSKINDGIQKIRSNGTYEEISKKYFDFDPYGD